MLKIGRKEAHNMIDPSPFRGRKIKGQGRYRPINAETENVRHLPKGRPTRFKLGTWMQYDDLHH